MQNRYVADVGDFGKYGLLRALCLPVSKDSDSRLSLGVIWYLVPEDESKHDGKHIAYLKPSRRNEALFRRCDPELYDALGEIVQAKSRNVKRVMEMGILPPGTIFCEEPLTFRGLATAQDRISHRSAWLRAAQERTKCCEIVFVDPDNGLEVKVKRHHKRGPKYVYFDELSHYLQIGQSLIVYHHLGRQRTAEQQIAERFAQFAERLPDPTGMFGLRYHRGTARVFFIFPSDKHADILRARRENLTRGCWGKHFTLVTPGRA